MLLALATGWRFARKPKLKWLLVASLVAVISVQCLFQNSFLLLAVCAAAAAEAARRDFKKRYRTGHWDPGGSVSRRISP
jgi:hypothetical protein